MMTGGQAVGNGWSVTWLMELAALRRDAQPPATTFPRRVTGEQT